MPTNTRHRRRNIRNQTKRGGRFIHAIKKLLGRDSSPLPTYQPGSSAPPFFDPLEAKDLMASLFAIADVLGKLNATTTYEINELKRRLDIIERRSKK